MLSKMNALSKVCGAGLFMLTMFATTSHAQQTPDTPQDRQAPQEGNAYWYNLPPRARESILQHNGGNIPPAYQLNPPPPPRRMSPEEITARSNDLIQNANAERQIGDPPIGDGWWYICDKTQVFYPWGGCPVKWRQVQPTSGADLPPKPDIPRWADGRPIGSDPVFLKMYNDNLDRLGSEYIAKIQQIQEQIKQRAIYQKKEMANLERKKIDERNGYKYISVSDFELDKYSMRIGQKIIVSGIFVSDGNVDYLRANLQRCRIGGMCSITLAGHLGSCQHTFLNTRYKLDRCLFVDDQR